VANTLNLFRNGAVGFIDWLDASLEITGVEPGWAELAESGWLLVALLQLVLE
jgi:hypothetical protein